MVWEGYRRGTGYIAVGVSEDSKMGKDIMFICSQVIFYYNIYIYIYRYIDRYRHIDRYRYIYRYRYICSKMCPTRVLICFVIITQRIMIRGVVRTLALVNCS